ncbi:hypothetical protein ACWEQV_21990 [Rhodococcus aetherivorans]|uniref:hypothetical protein n=1 Tax=Rhodococcus aetherivorans TaxID=191292 RepID=UPI00241D806F|nr:hypothetical protein [Rhodococcus aetherivorans]WFS13616.1 hypothetical protein P9K37_00350 [Rhodococcus aetherivorans]
MQSDSRTVPFEELDDADLRVGAIYLGGDKGNAGDDPLAKLLHVGNQGGFRYKGSPAQRTVRLAVLYTSRAEEEWPDEFDATTGVFTYFGDNRKPGRDLLDTTRKGNLLLKDTFALAYGTKEDRTSIPPFFLFEKAGTGRAVRFLGLLAPGGPDADSSADLTVVRHRASGGEFENYRARFTVLPTKRVSREWLRQVLAGSGTTSPEAPAEWLEWVEGRPGIAPRPTGVRPNSSPGIEGRPISPRVTDIPPESRVSERFDREVSDEIVAERRESALQHRYQDFLEERGHLVSRQKIEVPGEPYPLYTDLFDTTTGELIEAKSECGRVTIRQALGQILDYSRYVEHKSKAVLLPSKPSEDIIALLRSYRIAVVWESPDGKFQRLDPN